MGQHCSKWTTDLKVRNIVKPEEGVMKALLHLSAQTVIVPAAGGRKGGLVSREQPSDFTLSLHPPKVSHGPRRAFLINIRVLISTLCTVVGSGGNLMPYIQR